MEDELTILRQTILSADIINQILREEITELKRENENLKAEISKFFFGPNASALQNLKNP